MTVQLIFTVVSLNCRPSVLCLNYLFKQILDQVFCNSLIHRKQENKTVQEKKKGKNKDRTKPNKQKEQKLKIFESRAVQKADDNVSKGIVFIKKKQINEKKKNVPNKRCQ